jgi:hypothetical protein
MRIQPYKSIGRATIVFLLSIGVFSLIYMIDSRRDGKMADTGNDNRGAGGLLIDKIMENGRQAQRESETAESERRQKKSRASEAVLMARPKSSNVSFFLSSPYRASLAVPESWHGKFRAEDSDREFDLVYASSSGQTADILSIYLFNDDEWLKHKKQGSYAVLEELPGFVFAYREFGGAGLPKNEAEEYMKMKEKLPDIIKSFRSHRQ